MGRGLKGIVVEVRVEAVCAAAGHTFFQGGEAALHQVAGLGRGLLRGAAAEVGVDLDAVAEQAAEQLHQRQSRDLALDVPQRLVDPRKGAHPDRAAHAPDAGEGGLAVDVVPQVFDARRIAADQLLLHVLDRGADHRFLV